MCAYLETHTHVFTASAPPPLPDPPVRLANSTSNCPVCLSLFSGASVWGNIPFLTYFYSCGVPSSVIYTAAKIVVFLLNANRIMIPPILWFPAALGITSDLLQTPDFLSFPFTVHHPWPEIATHSSWSGRSWSLHLNVTSSERSCLVTLLFSFGAFITMCDCGFLNLVTRWTQLRRGRDASVLSLFVQSKERISTCFR